MKKQLRKFTKVFVLSLGLVGFAGLNVSQVTAQKVLTNTCKWNGEGCPKATMGCYC